VIEVSNTKQKDASLTESIYFELEEVTLEGWVDEDGGPVTSVATVPTEQPVAVEKIDTTFRRHRNMIEEAWKSVSGEIVDGLPYISESNFRDFLIKSKGKASKTATNMCREKGKLIHYLLDKKFIELHSDGWKIIDDGSVLSLTNGPI
jgi:hypothetical protein